MTEDSLELPKWVERVPEVEAKIDLLLQGLPPFGQTMQGVERSL